ncbi:hypothetical protein BHE74_00014578 [Ensete ventricosum]|nr:hypothetical protein BHE74_00014578 [Ensete ventricosum]
MNWARGLSPPSIRLRTDATVGFGRELARKLSSNSFASESKEEMDDGLSRLYHIWVGSHRVVGKAWHIREFEVPTHLFPPSGEVSSVPWFAELVGVCGLDHRGAPSWGCLTGVLTISALLLAPKILWEFGTIAEESTRPGPYQVRKLVRIDRGGEGIRFRSI